MLERAEANHHATRDVDSWGEAGAGVMLQSSTRITALLIILSAGIAIPAAAAPKGGGGPPGHAAPAHAAPAARAAPAPHAAAPKAARPAPAARAAAPREIGRAHV